MRKRKLIFILKIYQYPFFLLIIIGYLLMISPSIPRIWYKINKKAISEGTQSIIVQSEKNYKPLNANQKVDNIQPKKDLTLPDKNILIIDRIGVHADIIEGKNGKEALADGVWRTYTTGTPEDNDTVILASHRFGSIDWSEDFRKKNSFYHLPSLQKGDRVVIIWNQKRYVYELYKSSKGVDFENYPSDLILYTCEWYSTPNRIFKYFKKVN